MAVLELDIKRQKKYSRGELLLRTFFGWLYIGIPHIFLLAFLAIWGAILTFVSFFAILINGQYPKNFFDYQVKLRRWGLRVGARIYNLLDGYPEFGLDAKDDAVKFEVEYPKELSRGTLLLKFFFGWLYVGIPHGIILYFYGIACGFAVFIAWFIVLFTGKYPESIFNFIVGYVRWSQRVSLYLSLMTDEYPPFTNE